MQLRKFYGRTIRGALARVKRELGPEALILETRQFEPDSASARMNPGMRFEIGAVVEAQAIEAQTSHQAPKQNEASANPLARVNSEQPEAPEAATGGSFPNIGNDVLEELTLIKNQIQRLLNKGGGVSEDIADQVDLTDYYALIRMGVDHTVLAPPMRAWMEWRTAPPPLRQYIAQSHDGPARQMRGTSLREWLWLDWAERQGLVEIETESSQAQTGPKVIALMGPTGVGKTMTLAKLASRYRQNGRQNVAVLTLDTHRFGAVQQWRQMASLMDIELEEIVNDADLAHSMEHWDRFDWIGIDTPGGLNPGSAVDHSIGAILAQYPQLERTLVLPATYKDSVSRELLARGEQLGSKKIMFSKLDETADKGGIVNLTMDGNWKLAGFATGTRVPDDWTPATRQSLWSQVLEPQGAIAAS